MPRGEVEDAAVVVPELVEAGGAVGGRGYPRACPPWLDCWR